MSVTSAFSVRVTLANLRQISSARLITSYPIPPRTSFTCPPCSLRYRSSTKSVTRYTYISTRDTSTKVTLFKDTVAESGTTSSETVSTALPSAANVVFLTATTPSTSTKEDKTGERQGSDLIAVNHDGGIFCLDGETLKQKWQTSPDTVSQDLMATKGTLQVDFVQSGSAADVTKGFFQGKDHIFGLFAEKVEADGFNPDVLVLITSLSSEHGDARHLHILALSPAHRSGESVQRTLAQVHLAPLPPRKNQSAGKSLYRLDIPSGSLFELLREDLISYTLAGSVPRVENEISIPSVTSCLRLSKSSVLTSTSATFDVYNPLFHSLQASTALDIARGSNNAASNGHEQFPQLVAYFARLETAIAIVGTSLVAVQLDPPKSRGKKRRTDGLLIDSIGQGVLHGNAQREDLEPIPLAPNRFFSASIPGSVSRDYWAQYTADVQAADEMLAANDLAGFEILLAKRFDVQIEKQEPLTNGIGTHDDHPLDEHRPELPEWVRPESRAKYPEVDRRWIMYALSRAFSWDEESGTAGSRPRLTCRLPECNVINYLVDAGHLTVPNLKSALRDHARDVDEVESKLREELPGVLVNIDPTMRLMLTWLYSTQLGTVELLVATHLIMQSLELIQGPTETAAKMLTLPSGDAEDSTKDEPEDNSEFGMELDRLEQQLRVTEFHLDDETGTRARALSAAFNKLGSCPASSVVQTLRRIFRPEEILSLIYVLRIELVKDGWTSRYLDTTTTDLEAPPDGSVGLLADLLCRCIDSVGPGGWVISDTILAGDNGVHVDSSDFLKGLMHEVSATLEGVQEAVYLRGILGDTVKYWAGMQKVLGHREAPAEWADRVMEVARARPIVARAHDAASMMLPLGLKTPFTHTRHGDIAPKKVVAGGELVKRSKRELGYLTGKKVGPYTLERIVI